MKEGNDASMHARERKKRTEGMMHAKDRRMEDFFFIKDCKKLACCSAEVNLTC